MSLILSRLLLNSFVHAPHQSIDYHLDTVRIALRLMGESL